MNEKKYKKERIEYIADKMHPYTVAGCDGDLAEAIFNLVEEENARLKENWNSLKDIAKSQSELKQQCRNGSLWFEIDELLNKMKEIEEN